ncbi:uncharacterized protein A1O9_07856 [Exophiala aquamarina CBS 119918]|uniref:Zn(2)-C6 fungal-type domain-containing protein n=1 Tax=Exophiala aquamarina CBS 119918 TaxID=1182545 RepID=A0A072PLB9_9EURO|nr:uncharacterized protein A1O9_07856 [Exophiala aquamarina CBS 119918]KEF56275.1 hypothetical protein A1O9_07856 [Exophiala aquamarina CBS 119918]
MQRRSHKKSRKGCNNCKARRIKCGEEKPRCGNCLDFHAECIYSCGQAENPYMRANLQVHNFNLRDLQYFHHFLQAAIPHLPLGSDTLWVEAIPRLAYHRPYLMHALLGLGAFSLGALFPEHKGYNRDALDHRLYAIRGLNSAISNSCRESDDSSAILASCYALTFQSIYLADGMTDFIIFVRGCYLATNTLRGDGQLIALPAQHLDIVAPKLGHMLKPNIRELQKGLADLVKISNLLETPFEHEFYSGVKEVLAGSIESLQLGYVRFVSLYEMWSSRANVEALINPNNTVLQLMLYLYLLESLILAPFTPWDFPQGLSTDHRLSSTLKWADKIWMRLSNDSKAYLEWPKSVYDRLKATRNKVGDSSLLDELKDIFLAKELESNM